VALSPLLAVGGVAVAPVALGGVTIGILSLSLWGLALGGIALGSVSAGWCAFGIVAVGWKAAWGGGAAMARDFAIGGWTRAAEANTLAAREWFGDQWYSDGAGWFFRHAHWMIVSSVVVSVLLVLHRVVRLRGLPR
jgi:hypothetical protein